MRHATCESVLIGDVCIKQHDIRPLLLFDNLGDLQNIGILRTQLCKKDNHLTFKNYHKGEKYLAFQVINPPPMAVGAGNVDVDEDDDNAADMENNAGEDLDKVNAPVDMEEEDGEYVGDDEDGGQGRRQRLLLTRKDFWPMQCYFLSTCKSVYLKEQEVG